MDMLGNNSTNGQHLENVDLAPPTEQQRSDHHSRQHDQQVDVSKNRADSNEAENDNKHPAFGRQANLETGFWFLFVRQDFFSC